MITRNALLCVSMVLLLLTALAIPAYAQTPEEELDRAVELFDAGHYTEAQQVLLAIDRDSLTDEQREVRDRYVDEVRLAISLSTKAQQDFSQAETAFDNGDLDRAELLYRAVVRNDYATDDLRAVARDALARIDEKRQLDLALEQAEQEPGRAPSEARPAAPEAAPEPESQRASPREARALVARGQAALAQGDYVRARDSFEAALAIEPGMPEAVAGLNEARNMATVDARGESLMDRIRFQRSLLWSRTEATYRQLEAEVRQAVANEDFDTANMKVLRARQVIESGRPYADPVSLYENLRDQVDDLDRYVKRQEELWSQRELQAKREEVARQEEARREQIEESRRIRIESLMDQARQFQRERRLEQAIDALRQVEAIDPTNDRAKWMREDLENTLFLWNQSDFREELYAAQSEAVFDAEKAKMPALEVLKYPKNWPEITARRMPYNLGMFGSADASAAARARLSAVVPEVKMDALAFDNALDELHKMGGFNMHVNWRALTDAGVDPKTAISADLSDVRLEKALSLVLADASLPDAPLAYEVDDGVVTISTREDLDRRTVTRVYDIRDLVVHVPNFDDAPNIELRPSGNQIEPRRDRMSESLFDADREEPLSDTNPNGSVVAKILDTIRDTVYPGTWRAQNGLVGSIRELNGQIIVTHTLQAQEQLTSLLDQLRETRNIQVNVEARFLTVRTNFLEDIGMDLDIILNSGNAGFDTAMVADANGIPQVATDPATGGTLLVPRQFSRLGFLPGTPALGTPYGGTIIPNQPYGQVGMVPAPGDVAPHSGQWTPVPILSNVLGFADPRNIQTGVPGTFAGSAFQEPAFQMFGSFLDNIQVDFLLRATQADGRSTFLEAPRLTLSNGQRGYVAVVTQQAYISGLNAVVAEEVGQVEPEISTLNTGSVLDVEATVGADRRYVTLTVRAGRAILEELVPVEVQSTGTSTRGVGAVVQLPRVQVALARATITVPEGGTVLLGGLRQAGEVELEGGVPILSKIPVLKRAYSSRSTAKDENVLLMMIKPTIVILEEAEEEAFPSFSMR